MGNGNCQNLEMSMTSYLKVYVIKFVVFVRWRSKDSKPWIPFPQGSATQKIKKNQRHPNQVEKKGKIQASVDDLKDRTADCLSLASVLPSMRTKPIPFSHMNSWKSQHEKNFTTAVNTRRWIIQQSMPITKVKSLCL